MANTAPADWRVLPHSLIEKVSEGLWRVEGSLPKMALRRVMTLAKMADGGVVIHSAVALDEPMMRELEAWGTPAYLLVPNGYHRLDAPAFKRRYPALKVLCPRGSRRKVEEVVKVDGTYEDFPADPYVSLQTLAGVKETEGVMCVRASEDDLTLVFNDVVFNMPHSKGLIGWVLRHITASSGGPRVSRIARLFMVKDAQALRADLLRLASLPGLRRVIVSHHEMITGTPAETLRAVADSL
jgi:hypothetical protein